MDRRADRTNKEGVIAISDTAMHYRDDRRFFSGPGRAISPSSVWFVCLCVQYLNDLWPRQFAYIGLGLLVQLGVVHVQVESRGQMNTVGTASSDGY